MTKRYDIVVMTPSPPPRLHYCICVRVCCTYKYIMCRMDSFTNAADLPIGAPTPTNTRSHNGRRVNADAECTFVHVKHFICLCGM